MRLLNAIRSAGLEKSTRLYQASTSELYGKVQEIPQKETTPFYPRSPYGVAKQYAYWMLINYREAYGMHASNGILFNHESRAAPRPDLCDPQDHAGGRAHLAGQDEDLVSGQPRRQARLGHARDGAEGMWLMVQRDPDDFVLDGECHSVKEFCEVAFARVGITVQWKGAAGSVDEIGVDAKDPNRVPRQGRPQATSARRRSTCSSATAQGQEAAGLDAQGHLQGRRGRSTPTSPSSAVRSPRRPGVSRRAPSLVSARKTKTRRRAGGRVARQPSSKQSKGGVARRAWSTRTSPSSAARYICQRVRRPNFPCVRNDVEGARQPGRAPTPCHEQGDRRSVASSAGGRAEVAAAVAHADGRCRVTFLLLERGHRRAARMLENVPRHGVVGDEVRRRGTRFSEAPRRPLIPSRGVLGR